MVEDKPQPFDEIKNLVKKGKLDFDNLEELDKKINSYRVELTSIFKKSHKLYNELNDSLELLNKEMVIGTLED